MLVDRIDVLSTGSNALVGVAREKTLTQPGEVVTVVGVVRWYVPTPIRLTSVVARLGVPTQGSPMRIVVKKDNIPIHSGYIEIPAGVSETVLPASSLTKPDASTNDFYTVDVVQVGTTVKGSDLTVQLNYVTTQQAA